VEEEVKALAAVDGKPPVEKWFIRRGVPHFIARYSATEDVFTRALPVLIVWFLLSSSAGIDPDWTWRQQILVAAAGLVLLLLSWSVLSAYRKRPLLSRPQRIGWPEIAIFILVPTTLPLIFGVDWDDALATLVTQVVFIGVVFLITSYGLVALSMWAIGRLVVTLTQTFRLFTRGLPLLLIALMFLFINANSWQSAGQLDRALLWTVAAVFAALAGVFLASQIPRELQGLNEFTSWTEASAAASDAPIHLAATTEEAHVHAPTLSRKERWNLYLVVFIAQYLRLLLVSVLIGAFFVGLGLLIIQPATISLWTNQEVVVLWGPWELFGNPIQLTNQLLQVAIFLGGFAALYFSVYANTDKNLRSEFFEDTTHEIRQDLAARAIYLQQDIGK
jgi:hypothetical protein